MDKDRIAGAIKTVVGNVKEAVGKLVGDQKTIVEGQAEQKIGKAQNALGSLRDTARDIEKAKHMPEAPVANFSKIDPGDHHEIANDTPQKAP